ncbi:MAG: TraR/DksA C4-type zinc finger protein [Planctomycetota bacterium]
MTIEQAMELEWTIPKLRRVKSGLTRKQIAEYRAMLIEKRAEIMGDVKGMESARSASLDDISHMPLHMADVGTDMFEQEFTLGLIESERRMLVEITEALHRIEDKIYGVCMASGRPIGAARLEFKPWAKYCIEVARLREKRGL